MYGWRCKLGLIVPHNNITTEPEFYAYVPDGISIHTCRMKGRGNNRNEIILDMIGQANEAAKRFFIDPDQNSVLEDLPTVDAIAFACFRSSFYRGMGWDEDVRRGIESASNIPTTTAASSIIKCMKKMNVKKIGVVSPYPEESNERLKKFLGLNGFEVKKIVNMFPATRNPYYNNLVPTWKTYELGRLANDNDVDGVLISVTNVRTFEILQKLEKDINKPVISANQALLWDLFNIIGINEEMPELGKLFLM